jgi:hypothetical protein
MSLYHLFILFIIVIHPHISTLYLTILFGLHVLIIHCQITCMLIYSFAYNIQICFFFYLNFVITNWQLSRNNSQNLFIFIYIFTSSLKINTFQLIFNKLLLYLILKSDFIIDRRILQHLCIKCIIFSQLSFLTSLPKSQVLTQLNLQASCLTEYQILKNVSQILIKTIRVHSGYNTTRQLR